MVHLASLLNHFLEKHIVIPFVDQIRSIRNILKTKKKIEFTELFESFRKDYVVVTFLSILNMSKNNEIILSQKDNFSPIMIESRL